MGLASTLIGDLPRLALSLQFALLKGSHLSTAVLLSGAWSALLVLHAVLSRPCMHTSLYLPLAASRPCVRADAYREAHGVGEAGLFPFRFKCPYCPTEQMTSQCRELHF